MGNASRMETTNNSDEESGDAFTDGDFGDSEDETVVIRNESSTSSHIPINETINLAAQAVGEANGVANDDGDDDLDKLHVDDTAQVNGHDRVKNGHTFDTDELSSDGREVTDVRRESHSDQSPSIVGILGDQQNHAEQRLAARRAARAEAREIRMRELERQQRQQEDHADKAYDMYTETIGRRAGSRLAALSPGGLHSPRRSSEDSVDESFSVKDLRHELKEVEEKFRKAMILNAQLDNDKAALAYQLELLKDRIEELLEEYAQLQREHREKCSSHERLKREHASLERELCCARDAVRARDAAAAGAGFAFVEATGDTHAAAESFGTVPPLALVSHQAEQLLNDAGEGTLDVRLQKLLSSKQSLESEVRKLKLQLNEERSARQNGVVNHHDQEYENELEMLRKSVTEAKARAARAEAEAERQATDVARLEGQVTRLRAREADQDKNEELLKQEKRKLLRETREALDRVEELQIENNHLTKRLDKLKNAKSALLKEL